MPGTAHPVRPPGPPLTEEERWLLRQLEDEDGADSVLAFVPFVSPRFEQPQHLRALANFFVRAETEGNVYMCASTPPRHSKTETLMHGAARYISRNPHKTVGYVTYAAGLAAAKSKRCREFAMRAGARVARGSNRADQWRTEEGGGLIACGIGGQLTGQGLDLLIVDDPLKNREEAESDVQREKVHDFFTSTALSRLEPGGSCIVNMARWHQDDLIGVLSAPLVDGEDRIRYDYLNLAALDELGNALWPSRWPHAALDLKRRLVGEYDWASLYMGQPVPRGGALFREPARYDFAEVPDRLVIACDPAASAKTSADHSAIVVLGARGTGQDQVADVLEVIRERVEIPTLVEKLRVTQRRWKAPVYVEAQGGFKGVAQALRHIDPGMKVYEIAAIGDKFTRALPASAAWNDGRIRVPRDASRPWVREFIREVCRFTGKNDKEDDQVDALSHAFNQVDQRHAATKRGVQAMDYRERGIR